MKCIILVAALLPSISLFALDRDHKKFLNRNDDESMVYIPAGTVYFYPSDSDVPLQDSARPRMISVKSFFISPYELTNQQYLEYLYHLSRSDKAAFSAALPDTLVWRSRLAFQEPFVDYYLRHPAYYHYPVVGVTHEQATRYCEWLTRAYNESVAKKKYKKVLFRLPSRDEWHYAATCTEPVKESRRNETGEFRYYDYGRAGDYPNFPWGTHYLQDGNGQWLANFSPINQASVQAVEGTLIVDSVKITNRFYMGSKGEYMGVAGALNDGADLVAPVYTYRASAMGIYNMAGNVEEMVAEYGITKGGAWNDTGYYLRNDVEETYDSTNETTCARGFRIAMDVVEYWP